MQLFKKFRNFFKDVYYLHYISAYVFYIHLFTFFENGRKVAFMDMWPFLKLHFRLPGSAVHNLIAETATFFVAFPVTDERDSGAENE